VVGGARGHPVALWTPDGMLRLPATARGLAARLALMPSLPVPGARQPSAALRRLARLGVLAPHDLPRRIVPDAPATLDGWHFA
jgi:hypothetical protein